MDRRELRIAIGELLGYRVEWMPNRQWARLVALDGTYPSARCWEDGWVRISPNDPIAWDAWTFAPDWPGDTGAALALCLDVFGGVTIERGGEGWLNVETPPNAPRAYATRVADKDVAMAMVDIVLAALRTQAVSDG